MSGSLTSKSYNSVLKLYAAGQTPTFLSPWTVTHCRILHDMEMVTNVAKVRSLELGQKFQLSSPRHKKIQLEYYCQPGDRK